MWTAASGSTPRQPSSASNAVGASTSPLADTSGSERDDEFSCQAA
jgi:hypothetical protein